MYENVRSRVRVSSEYSEEFSVKVGVHQGSVLSPLLFIIVLDALSQEHRTGCPWELLYADDLVIISDNLEELLQKVQTWKDAMEDKGLRINMGKTKIMISGPKLDLLKKSGQDPCAVCLKGVGSNSMQCGGCSLWVHNRCKDFEGVVKSDPKYRCPRCQGTARPIDGRPMVEVQIGEDKVKLGLALHRQFDMALGLVHGLAGHSGAVMGEAYRREGAFVLDRLVE